VSPVLVSGTVPTTRVPEPSERRSSRPPLAARRGWPALTGSLDEHCLLPSTASGVERLMADRVTRLL
jgi:hypothetical protein